MIKELAKHLDLFPGPENQTRCFAHVLNLIAKSIIRQFDVLKAQQNQALDESARELQALAGDIDHEEQATMVGVEIGSDEDEDDNMDGWIDERERMSAKDVEELDESVQPVRFMLVKVIQSPLPFRHLLTHISCAKLRTRSRTLQRSFYPDGLSYLKSSNWSLVWCHATSLRDGTLRLICFLSLCNTEVHWIRYVVIGI
jgi:hypothetical protein